MNENIKRIWNESINDDDTWEGQVRFLETFAQNIIKECTDICIEQSAEYKKDAKAAYDSEEKEIYYEGIACADRIRYKINRMFGVKPRTAIAGEDIHAGDGGYEAVPLSELPPTRS